MGDANPKETFGYVARELKKRNISFIFVRERQGARYLTPCLKAEFGGKVIANEVLTPELAEQMVSNGTADLVSFGMLYIANPDLVERMQTHRTLNKVNVSTIHGSGVKGYTDYPKMDSEVTPREKSFSEPI